MLQSCHFKSTAYCRVILSENILTSDQSFKRGAVKQITTSKRPQITSTYTYLPITETFSRRITLQSATQHVSCGLFTIITITISNKVSKKMHTPSLNPGFHKQFDLNSCEFNCFSNLQKKSLYLSTKL